MLPGKEPLILTLRSNIKILYILYIFIFCLKSYRLILTLLNLKLAHESFRGVDLLFGWDWLKILGRNRAIIGGAFEVKLTLTTDRVASESV